MINEAVILAGGLGTRLKGVINDIPKPMAPVNNTPFLQYLFEYLIKQNITHVVLAVGYKYEVIKTHFGNQYKTLKLNYAIEDTPLGTGGGIANAISQIISDQCLLLNGDTFFDVNLEALCNDHTQSDADLSLSLKEMHNFDRYGTVKFNESRIITSFNEKTAVNQGFINGGVYVLKKSIFDPFDAGQKFSFEKDILETKVNLLKINAHICSNYFIDIGIPKDYKKANIDLPRLFNEK